MKKYINLITLPAMFFFSGCFVAAIVISCAKINPNPESTSAYLKIRNNDKVKICHHLGNNSWIDIEVDINAIETHLNHGDILLDFDNDGYYSDNKCGFEPGGDCDDNNPNIFPGKEEICGDGIDQDCDGIDSSCELNCIDIPCCFCDILDDLVVNINTWYCDSSATWLNCGGCVNAVQYETNISANGISLLISTYTQYCPEKMTSSYCYVYTPDEGYSYTPLDEDSAEKCRSVLRKFGEDNNLNNQCSSGVINCSSMETNNMFNPQKHFDQLNKILNKTRKG